MGQIQQICAKNLSNQDSSISDVRLHKLKREYFRDQSSKMTFDQSTVITETLDELKLKLSQDEDKQNQDVETNISIVESFQKLETKNLSQRELDEITDLNVINKSDAIKSRSKSVFIRNILPEIPPKSILKNREILQDQEKRNFTQQKRVRFSIKELQKNKLLSKYNGYKKISYI
ncbi:unnamed protein product [Paramecium pentaurelia]|uniref:Uncharacterized protein n=1 Tax=Paramecium pentaurelia TaxID=43138 RepID=A0A8S1SD61_9CILI|nr:unnamed protein product [Paramecium pentaurelia]